MQESPETILELALYGKCHRVAYNQIQGGVQNLRGDTGRMIVSTNTTEFVKSHSSSPANTHASSPSADQIYKRMYEFEEDPSKRKDAASRNIKSRVSGLS